MIAVITGDIINSRTEDVAVWLPVLKSELQKIGTDPNDWEIYRGDSFQLKTTPKLALKVAFKLKTALKQFKTLDVRMAIGIGEESYIADKVTEANGSAYVNSGECFEELKKQTLAIKTPWKDFNVVLNLVLDVLELTVNNWTPNYALLIKESLEDTTVTQKELAEKLDKKQSNISTSLKKAGFDEILKILDYYNTQIEKLC
ncbi:MAG: SatD family protein [Cellulophaga sp.]|uniref:SatD family protein n=1 Tax=unclassified Cellulophaga TaxID=2634405 RepID=UPI0026E21AFB|nr:MULTISPECIES: SatD family protein [unclassified Cellulophaga]MDO6490953.1 SatD family protein [Cellulophaga sp. 2_MG-2023]MDO6493853.1 SatD family protein [Cellulophaga sp. 3_MG-2023]